MTMDAEDTGPSTRERILAATADLLTSGGREAVSTRTVSAAAGVQPPTIYRLFGDKQGLLDAVAVRGYTDYLEGKTRREPTADPVEDLRAGWDLHVEFGLANPAVYALMSEPRPAASPPPAAVTAGIEVLAALIRRIAEAGRLRVAEHHAVNLVHAAGTGTTLALIATPAEQRDPTLSRLAREAVIAAITTDAPAAAPGPAGAAITMRAALPQTTALTDGERALMGEWLDRIADEPARQEGSEPTG
jgi:AcrR family transcriptional regulator